MSLSFEDSLKLAMQSQHEQGNHSSQTSEPMLQTIPYFEEYAASGWQQSDRYAHYDDYSDDSMSTVDDKKNVVISNNQPSLTQESNSQFIPFEMPRYYDGFDLLQTKIMIHFVNKDGGEGRSNAVNVSYNDTSIRFAWLVNKNATAAAGNLRFEIEARGINSKGEPYCWKSRPNASLNVEQSLAGNGMIKPDNSWLNGFLDLCTEEVAKAQAHANNAKASADAARQSEDEAAKYAANANKAMQQAKNHADNAGQSKDAARRSEEESRKHAEDASISADKAIEAANSVDSFASNHDKGMVVHISDAERGAYIANMSIYGRTVQNLFPLLETKTIDGVTFTVGSNGYVSVKGTPTKPYTTVSKLVYGVLQCGCTYTLSCEESQQGYAQVSLYTRDALIAQYDTSKDNTVTFTVPDNYHHFIGFVSCGPDTEKERGFSVHPVLVYGEEAQPFASCAKTTSVENATIRVCGKNMSDKAAADESGAIRADVTMEAGKQYSISFDAIKEESNVYFYLHESRNHGIHVDSHTVKDVKKGRSKSVFTPKRWGERLVCYATGGAGSIRNLQIEHGGTATAFEKYTGTDIAIGFQGHKLRSLPGVCDVMTIASDGVVVINKNIAEESFTYKESYYTAGSGKAKPYMTIPFHPYESYSNAEECGCRKEVVSSHYYFSPNDGKNLRGVYRTWNSIIIFDEDFADAKTAVRILTARNPVFAAMIPVERIQLGKINMPKLPGKTANIWIRSDMPAELYAEWFTSRGMNSINAIQTLLMLDKLPGVLPPSKGGTGKTSLRDALQNMVSGADSSSTPPTDNDWYLCSNAGNPDSKEVNKRPIKSLWEYLKKKTDALYSRLGHKHDASDVNVGTLDQARLPIVSVSKGGTGAENKLDAARNLCFSSLARTVELEEGTDLDNIITPGSYASSNLNKDIKNCPVSNKAFRLEVSYPLGGDAYIKQEMSGYFGDAGADKNFRRYRLKSTGYWTPWIKTPTQAECDSLYALKTDVQRTDKVTLKQGCYAKRNGKIVTITVDTSANIGANFTSLLGNLPAAFRPNAECYNSLVIQNVPTSVYISVSTGGDVRIINGSGEYAPGQVWVKGSITYILD